MASRIVVELEPRQVAAVLSVIKGEAKKKAGWEPVIEKLTAAMEQAVWDKGMTIIEPTEAEKFPRGR